MKAVIVACLCVVLLAITPLQKYEDLLRQDTCASKVLDTMQPEIKEKAEEFANAETLEKKVEVLALIHKGVEMMDKCFEGKKTPSNAVWIEHDAISLLLASNCEKDAGMMLLLADEIKKDPKNIPQDIIIAIFEVILEKQTEADCKQAYNYIIHHH